MATFNVWVTPDPDDGTVAHVEGRFSGGASDYSYRKQMYITVSGVGTFGAWSPEESGGENTFELDITGLTPGTTYNWSASLYTKVPGDWAASDYTDKGSFTTAGGSSVTSDGIYINIGSATSPNWMPYRAYINIGSATSPNWVPYQKYVNYGSDNSPTWR